MEPRLPQTSDCPLSTRFPRPGTMEFDENIAKLQGTISSLGNRGMLNEPGSIPDVVAALQRVVCSLSDDDKTKLTFFMVLNTRLSVSEILKGDDFVSLFTNITPYIEKEYLITYAYLLNLQLQLFRVIENCPGALGIELLEDIIKKLKQADFHKDEYGIEHLYHLWQSVFVKIYKIDKGLHLNCYLEKFLYTFQDIYDLIKKIIVTSMKVKGLEMFVGYHLYNFFKAVLCCLKTSKGPNLLENPIYKLSVHLDTNVCGIKNPINVCFKMVFDDIFSILENITVDLWMTFSECHFDSNAKDSAQILIGDLVYNILEEVKQFNVPPKVLNCLSSLSINKMDLIHKAEIDEIISNVEDEEKTWFEVLVNHPKFLEKKSVKCVLSHLHLAGVKELTTILSTSYEYLCNCKDSENLDLIKELFLAAIKRTQDSSQWLEKVFEEYRPNLLKTSRTDDEVIKAFNKMSKDRSIPDCELICLCMQSPFDTIKRICHVAINGSQQTEFVIDALKLLKRACSVSLSDGFTLIDCVLLKYLEEDLSEKEMDSFVNLVVLLEKRNFLGPAFLNNLLKILKKYLEEEKFEKALPSLEIIRVLLEAKLLHVDSAAFLVFMSQVLEHLTWDVATFSNAKAEGRDRAARIVASALNGLKINESGSQFQWARQEILKSWEGNQAHFCSLWLWRDWMGSGKFISIILALAHSHRNGGDLREILIGVDRPSEVRASVVLSLFTLLPVMSFLEWNLIFDLLVSAFESINSAKSDANFYEDALDLFGSSLHLLTLTLKIEDKMYPCYKYCLRNFMRLTKRYCPGMNEASLLRIFERIIQFHRQIEDKEKRESCGEISSPVLAELIELLRKKCAVEADENRIKELLRVEDAEDAVAVVFKALRRKEAFRGKK